MKYPLAIFAPHIGARSETFIQRHMQDLLPGKTVVVARWADKPYAGHWDVACPKLVLKHTNIQPTSLRQYVMRSLANRLGTKPYDEQEVVKRFLREHGVQVILAEFLNFALPWLEVAQELGVRFYGHAHGFDVSACLRDSKWRTGYQRYVDADGIIARTSVTRTRLVELGLPENKIHIVPGGIDVPEVPRERNIQSPVHCIAVGRMIAKKAPILTLDAFRRAVETCPNLHLDYVGSGELFPAAHQFVKAFDLEHKVTLHGSQPSSVVQDLMKEADIFLQHSMTDPETGDEEGLPASITEAMAHALPVISTRHAGIPEAVREAETGFLVDEGDSAGMAEHIVTLAENPELRQRMGRAGWERAKSCFTWEREKEGLLRVMGIN